MEFSRVLRETRKRADWSQAEMAEKLGISRASLSLYETGKQTPGLDVLDALHQVTGAPLDYLMGYTDNYTSETLGVDKKIGLSTKSIETLSQNADLQKMVNHLLESDDAEAFFLAIAHFNQFSRDYRDKDGVDVVLLWTMKAYLHEASSILKRIYSSDGKSVLISGHLPTSKEARARIVKFMEED